MKRWLALALGLSAALAAAALLVLGGAEPREQIDARSRADLERVLEEAEREGSAR